MEPNDFEKKPLIPIPKDMPDMVPKILVPNFDGSSVKRTFAPKITLAPDIKGQRVFVSSNFSQNLKQTNQRIFVPQKNSGPKIRSVGVGDQSQDNVPIPETIKWIRPSDELGQAEHEPDPVRQSPQTPEQIGPIPRPEMILRTFQADTAQAIQRGHVSSATIAIAESIKNKGESSLSNEEPRHYGKKIAFTILSIVLVVAGGYTGYYVYQHSPLANHNGTNAQQNLVPSIVSPDVQKIVDVTGMSNAAIAAAVKKTIENTEGGIGGMTEFVFAKKVSIADPNNPSKTVSKMQKLSAVEFLKVFEITPPDIFTRSMTDSWMFGVYHQGEITSVPFIILTNNLFQNTYSGVVQWETNMADDFQKLFIYKNLSDTTTIGSSTVPANFYTIRGNFTDSVTRNKDVRVFTSETGQNLLLYSFIDKNTLVIAPNDGPLIDIVSRIEKRAYVR